MSVLMKGLAELSSLADCGSSPNRIPAKAKVAEAAVD
jgi:hypothetical protein